MKNTLIKLLGFAINYFYNPQAKLWSKFSIKTSCARRIRGEMQTPIIQYCHPQGFRIKFIAVCHFGTQDYFDNISREISDAEECGAAILCEGVKWDSDNEDEKKLADSYFAILDKIKSATGLWHQLYCLSYKKSWLYPDLSISEIIAVGGCIGTLKRMPAKEIETWLYVFLMNFAIEFNQLLVFITKFWKRGLEKSNNLRNEVAISEAFKRLGAGNQIVMVWGANHLRGMSKMLLTKGFSEEKRRWITAYKTMPLPKV